MNLVLTYLLLQSIHAPLTAISEVSPEQDFLPRLERYCENAGCSKCGR